MKTITKLASGDGNNWGFEQQLVWSLSSIYWNKRTVEDHNGNKYNLTCEYQGKKLINDFIIRAGLAEDIQVTYPAKLDPFAKPKVKVVNPDMKLIENYLMKDNNRGLCISYAKWLVSCINKERGLKRTYCSDTEEMQELLKEFRGEDAKPWEY